MAGVNANLGPMPNGKPMRTVDEQITRAPVARIFNLARDVENWPAHLPHYRFVRFREMAAGGNACGTVEMSANRPFELGAGRRVRLNWPTWWLSLMQVDAHKPSIRFRHIGGITKGMDVEWSFAPTENGTQVRIVHVWEGPELPILGVPLARYLIGPVFIHGIALRTLAGLIRVAESDFQTRGGGLEA